MNWTKFQTHHESNERAFETFCNQLFEKYCYREFSNEIKDFVIVNGAGGDGGVESYATLQDKSFIGLQAKWFPQKINDSQFKQIENSIITALNVRPNIKQYIVCIPRNLGNTKKGHNNKNIQSSEYSKWEKLIETFKCKYPELNLILWGDHEILTQLQNPECCYLKRYWFDPSSFDYSILQESFNREKGSWLKYKYFHELHKEGQISETLRYYIGVNKDKLLSNLNDIENNYIDILRILDEVKIWCNISDKLNNTLEQIIISVKEELKHIEQNKEFINQEKYNCKFEDIKPIDFTVLIRNYNKIGSGISSHYSRQLEKIIEKNNKKLFSDIKNNAHLLLSKHVLWIIGSPGTGKTHGVAGFIDHCLQETYNIPIFITAKNINYNASWKDILIKSLGLSNSWSENEILSALESLCIFSEIKNTSLQNNKKTYKAKIIICIDGLDEVQPYNFWINKINEANVIGETHKRIKFIFTSRHNVAELVDLNDDINQLMFYVNEEGDTSPYLLFDSYIKYYNIQIEQPRLIKYLLRTPLALKLFCEIFQNKKINSVQNKICTITSLIQQKLSTVEKEFCQINNKFQESNKVIWNTLSILADYFTQNIKLYETKLVDMLLEDDNLPLLEKQDVIIILEVLENNGFIQRYIEHKEGLFSPAKTYFMKGIQPFFDYALAVLYIERYDNYKDIELAKEQSDDCLAIFATLLLEKKNILISSIPNFKSQLPYHYLLALQFFALVNSEIEISKKYKERILRIMATDATLLMLTLNQLILPLTRITKHPLGALLLHEFLSKFEKPMQRDLLWSIQMSLINSKGQKWTCLEKCTLDPKIYQLTLDDNFDGLPLIYAWSLTNINNIKREEYRKELMKWALLLPKEFIKLFDISYKATNDPQMKEELLAIAMGLLYSKCEDTSVLEYFKEFIFKEIFTKSKILSINNIAIRQYARCIAQYLFVNNLITEDELSLCVPFFINNSKIHIDIKETTKNRDESKNLELTLCTISRLILKDKIDYLFFKKEPSDRQNNEEYPELYNEFEEDEVESIIKKYPKLRNADKEKLIFLKKYLIDHRKKHEDNDEAEQYGNKDLKSNDINYYNNEAIKFLKNEVAKNLGVDFINWEQFILGAAFEYLKQHGLSEDTECADKEIYKYFSSASDDLKSEIMTLAEKYIWCFRHEIYGLLSDKITPKNDYHIDKIEDYSLLVSDLINPAQEIYNVEYEKPFQDLYTYENAPSIFQNIENSKSGIKTWIKDAPIPQFENLIEIKNYKPLLDIHKQRLSLYFYNKAIEPNLKTQTDLFLTSLIISKSSFPLFLKDIKNKRKALYRDLFTDNEPFSQTLTDLYITPKEICQMPWKVNYCEELTYNTISKNRLIKYKLIKCIEKCTARFAQEGEVYYKIPSKYIRELVNISDGNGIKYTNKNNETVAQFFNIECIQDEGNAIQNFLCIDKSLLLEKLKTKNEMLVWIVRLIRKPSMICRVKYKDLVAYKDSTYIVWCDETKCNWQQYCVIDRCKCK